jgi:hypothetical protein
MLRRKLVSVHSSKISRARRKEKLDSPLLTFGTAKKAGSGGEIFKDNPTAQNGVKTFLLLDTYAFASVFLSELYQPLIGVQL